MYVYECVCVLAKMTESKQLKISWSVHHALTVNTTSKLKVLPDTAPVDMAPANAYGAQLRETMYNAATALIGFPKSKHADCFDENHRKIEQLLSERRKCYQAVLNGRGTQQATSQLKDTNVLLQKELWCLKQCVYGYLKVVPNS